MNSDAFYLYNAKTAQRWETYELYNNIKDSVDLWVNSKLDSYRLLNEIGEYKIDSIICINCTANKLRVCILSRCLKESCK